MLWRVPFFLRDFFKENTRNGRISVVIKHFLMFFVDLFDTPFVVMSILILVTGWRAPAFIRGYLLLFIFVPISSHLHTHTQLFNTFIISCWVMSSDCLMECFVVLIEWRLRNTRSERRRMVWSQFIYWLLDIPTSLMFLILLITFYRFSLVWKALKQICPLINSEEFTVKTSLLKITHNIWCVIVLQIKENYWRYSVEELRRQQQEQASSSSKVSQRKSSGIGDRYWTVCSSLLFCDCWFIFWIMNPCDVHWIESYEEENPRPVNSSLSFWSWHIIVWKQFGELLLDIPFPILTLLTLWRMPWLLRRVFTEVCECLDFVSVLILKFFGFKCSTARERRIMVLRYLLRVLKGIKTLLLSSSM